MATVFISYHRQSEALTKALADDIEALGHTVWFDQEISGGQSWWDQILKKIRQSDVFVFVLDEAAWNSTACKREYGYAAELGKPILPVLASRDVSINRLPSALTRIQFVEYRKSGRDAIIRLVKAFNALPSTPPLPDLLPLPPEAPISYLGDLAEQVEAPSTLSREQQSVLLLDLKRAMQDPAVADDAMMLLETFRKRADLLATIADEIDALRDSETTGLGTTLPAVQTIDETPAQRPLAAFHANGASRFEDTHEVVTNAVDGYELVLIPGGSFMMGSPEGEEGRGAAEGPQHEVQVPSFYMGRYPVTNAQYWKFLTANPDMPKPEYGSDREYNQPQQPVVVVSWADAQAYARWAGLRLPTEAEWEYACRGGTTTRFYSGNKEADLALVGWYLDNSSRSIHPVGENTPNAYGLYDMHGQVWEWVEDDGHDGYNGAPEDGSAWIDVPRGTSRVIRGGSWFSVAGLCRAASRLLYDPGNRHDFLGFRLSRSFTLGKGFLPEAR